MPTPAIDIAIVNYGSADDTLQALERLAPWTHGTIWLVDNSVDPAQTQQLQAGIAAMPGVKLVTSPENLGFGRACNLAFAKSDSAYFLLLNPDARIAHEAIAALASALEQDAALAAVSPLMFWNDEKSFVIPHDIAQSPWASVCAAAALHYRRLAFWWAGNHLARMRQQYTSQAPFDVEFLTGAVLLVRRSAIAPNSTLFDPDFFMFYEDSDLSMRLRRQGYRLALVPNAHAVHGYRHKAYKAELMTASRNRYFRKHFPVFFAATDQLRWLDNWSQPTAAVRWFEVLPGPLRTASEFAEQTVGCEVLAFSPLVQMVPAIFRPPNGFSGTWSDAEWALLEPGRYVVLLRSAKVSTAPRWVAFERSA